MGSSDLAAPGDTGQAKPIRHLSLPDAVRLTLRRQIINNELPEGTRLLEAKLAEEFGVSRTTLRSALRELKNDGLVEISPRRGCFVARMDAEDIHDICFARYVLEAGAASEMRVDDELLAELEEVLAAMAAAAEESDLEAVVSIDTRLHGVIVERGGGRRVVELWHGLDSQMGSLMRSSLERQGIDLHDSYRRHRKYVDAFVTRRRAAIVKEIRRHYLDPVEPPER
ncbi:MAG TPA: GntR family transcriptional regulator [Solirubrobacteraceae bacterium]|nr:GntR family transcriptional regulator [Solirubrobacteraceae bacterium]